MSLIFLDAQILERARIQIDPVSNEKKCDPDYTCDRCMRVRQQEVKIKRMEWVRTDGRTDEIEMGNDLFLSWRTYAIRTRVMRQSA